MNHFSPLADAKVLGPCCVREGLHGESWQSSHVSNETSPISEAHSQCLLNYAGEAPASVLVISPGTPRVQGDRNILFTLDPPAHSSIIGRPFLEAFFLSQEFLPGEYSSGVAFHRYLSSTQGGDAYFMR